MGTQVQVIVSTCDRAGTRSFCDRLVDETFDSLDEANRIADPKRVDGVVVIVRPTYNEQDPDGQRFYREWRSFNGAEFHECRWDWPVSRQAIVDHVLEA